jgi:hypothetical protein
MWMKCKVSTVSVTQEYFPYHSHMQEKLQSQDMELPILCCGFICPKGGFEHGASGLCPACQACCTLPTSKGILEITPYLFLPAATAGVHDSSNFHRYILPSVLESGISDRHPHSLAYEITKKVSHLRPSVVKRETKGEVDKLSHFRGQNGHQSRIYQKNTVHSRSHKQKTQNQRKGGAVVLVI